MQLFFTVSAEEEILLESEAHTDAFGHTTTKGDMLHAVDGKTSAGACNAPQHQTGLNVGSGANMSREAGPIWVTSHAPDDRDRVPQAFASVVCALPAASDQSWKETHHVTGTWLVYGPGPGSGA